jgi:hypothetical protein
VQIANLGVTLVDVVNIDAVLDVGAVIVVWGVFFLNLILSKM